MKQFSYILALIFIGTGLQSFSQEKGTHEIYAGVGFPTTNDLLNLASDILVDGASAGYVTDTDQKVIPALGLGYKLAVANRWMLSLDAYYQSRESNIYIDDERDGSLVRSYLTVGLGTDYHYISRDWFQMYSGVGIACTFATVHYNGSSEDIDDGSYNFINFQLNALGFRFGKTIAFFTELGFGYKGLLHAGLSLQL